MSLFRTRGMQRAVTVLVTTAVLVGAGVMQAAGGARPEAAIDAANRAFVAAFAKQDAAAIAALYAADAKLLPPAGGPVSGSAAIQAYWQTAFDSGVTGAELTTVEIEAYGKVAVEIGRFAAYNADGQQLDSGNYLVVWKVNKGQWQLYRDIWNSGAAEGAAE